MNAHLETSFSKGFFLTEEALIKIEDILKRRVRAVDPTAGIKFRVLKSDGMLLEFEEATAVAGAENSKSSSVKRVEVGTFSKSFRTLLKFDPSDGVVLQIDSTDRDAAYLLYSDLKEYTNSEILKFRKASFESLMTSRHVMPFIMLLIMFVPIYLLDKSVDRPGLDAAIASNDLNMKINYLLNLRKTPIFGNSIYVFALAPFLAIGTVFLGPLLDRIFPRNVFYWGKSAQSYDSFVAKRDKWIWGIGIAFVISVLSSLAVDRFKFVG